MKSLSSLSSTYFSGEDISNITSTAKTKNKIQRSSSFAGDDEGKKNVYHIKIHLFAFCLFVQKQYM